MSAENTHSTIPVPQEQLTPHLRHRIEHSPALARQFLISTEENCATEHDLADPIGDQSHSPVPGIVHRYPNRVLLMPTMSCAATCRFCFRRDRINQTQSILPPEGLDRALQYISDTPQIEEVIFSGGDPLTLPAVTLVPLLQRVATIAHVQAIRIHTRLPIVAPDRSVKIADMLREANVQKACWMVLHTNHVDELSPEVIQGLRAIQSTGCILLSQSVLLAGVNDDIDSLSQLFTRLVSLGIKPYYLHQLDLAAGTEHFRVPLSKGRKLMEALRGKISGLALPAYILDTPGGHGKVWATDAMVSQIPNREDWEIKTPDGTQHSYPSGAKSYG